MTPPEIRLFQYHLTKLIASVLQHEAFIGRVCTTLIQQKTLVLRPHRFHFLNQQSQVLLVYTRHAHKFRYIVF